MSVRSRWGHASRSGTWLLVWDSLDLAMRNRGWKAADTTQILRSNPRAEFKYLSPAFISWDYLEGGHRESLHKITNMGTDAGRDIVRGFE